MQKEIWKDIPNYEGLYQVSNLGRVKSVNRVLIDRNGVRKTIKERIIKQSVCKNYLIVRINKNAIKSSKAVHQLVAMAFLGHKPCGHKIVIDHINNIKTDNRVENLQLISNRENASKDRFRYNYRSKYVGVTWDKSVNKWRSRIYINGKDKYLGVFKDEYDAHLAYQKALSEI